MLAGLLLRFIGQSLASKILLAALAGGVVVGGTLLYLHNKFTAEYRMHISELKTHLQEEQDKRIICEQEMKNLKLDYEERLRKYQEETAQLVEKFLNKPPYRLPQNGTPCEKMKSLLREFQRRQTSRK